MKTKIVSFFNPNFLIGAICTDALAIVALGICLELTIEYNGVGDLMPILLIGFLDIFMVFYFHFLFKVHKGYIKSIVTDDMRKIKSVMFGKTLKCIEVSKINYVYMFNTYTSFGIIEPCLIFSEKEIIPKNQLEAKLPLTSGFPKDYIAMRINKRNYQKLKTFLEFLGIKIADDEYKELVLSSFKSKNGKVFVRKNAWNKQDLVGHSLIIGSISQ